MINLTKKIMILKTGIDLHLKTIEAIDAAKLCIFLNLYGVSYISPTKISASSRNEFFNASIALLFEDHASPSTAPTYDEQWIKDLYECSLKTPSPELAKKVVPKPKHPALNKTYLARLNRDAVTILHFLWHVGAVLLPLDTRRPTIEDPDGSGSKFFEFAAPTYPEVLALVRQPFVSHVKHDDIPDITSVMKPSAIKNFDWYAWRMVRASSWHRIEDIDPRDVAAFAEALIESRNGRSDWHAHPIAPKAFLSYVQKLYPTRCNAEEALLQMKNDARASKKNIEAGEFYIQDEHKDIANVWLQYQDKFIKSQKNKGLKSYKDYYKVFAILNTYLFGELPALTGNKPPLPNSFNRKHLEGDGFEGYLQYLKDGRTSATRKDHLYKLESFFVYLATHSSLDTDVAGFINPISQIDYPIVKKSSNTIKAAFNSEHFPLLLQYCYAIESFTWHLAERVHYDQLNLYSESLRADIETNNWNDAHKVIQTEKYGYVPLVFYKNPHYDPKKPASPNNRPMQYKALHLLPRFSAPIIEHSVQVKGQWVFYPQLNYIRHNLVALETGIRGMHIRWLDKRAYDEKIDRSRRLDPICKLHVNTDKSHGAWDSSVSQAVIEILDRQKSMLSWFADPSVDEEIWYDDHENSPFGKITTLFPKGGEPGPLISESYAKYFKRLIFGFDIFVRYSLGMQATNSLPEEFKDIESVDTPADFLKAILLEKKACKKIEHTPHSCRASVVSEYIRILPPWIIGRFITGQATESHVVYYAKLDPAYLKHCAEYQKAAFDQGLLLDRPAFTDIKTEDPASALQRAFKRRKEQSLSDFGAISFEREHNDEIFSGVKTLMTQPLEVLAFMSTHICPFGNKCPADVVRDLGAVPGRLMPCGECYYSIKVVDHLPRIHAHIRALTDECAELETHIAEARRQGASPESLTHKANHRKFLASEIIAWSVTAHCLEQMRNELKTRLSFLVEKPDIVTQQLERIVTEENSLRNLIARTSEAKSYAEYLTPQLQHQVIFARQKLLAFTHDINGLLKETPTGLTLIDEFRGLIRSICETLNLSVDELSAALENPIGLEQPETILRLASKVGGIKS